MQIIEGSNNSSFDMLLFPPQAQANQNYIMNNLQNFQHKLTDVGNTFMEGARQVYDRINDSETLRIARGALRMAKGMIHCNEISSLGTTSAIRGAQPIMQRYVMAEPILRVQFNRQLVDGYSDTYIDNDPNTVGENQYDYRRVMNGIVEFTDESWRVTTYAEDLLDGDRELHFDDQCKILSTWEIIRIALANEDDPTDIYA